MSAQIYKLLLCDGRIFDTFHLFCQSLNKFMLSSFHVSGIKYWKIHPRYLQRINKLLAKYMNKCVCLKTFFFSLQVSFLWLVTNELFWLNGWVFVCDKAERFASSTPLPSTHPVTVSMWSSGLGSSSLKIKHF